MTKPDASRRLMTVDEVAEFLAVSRSTVDKLVKIQQLNPSRIGTRLRFRPADIDAYIERRQVAARWREEFEATRRHALPPTP